MTTITSEPPASECVRPPSAGSTKRAARGYASGKDDYRVRLRRIEGQIRGLQKMIEDDRWCPDVVTQVAAAIRALQEVAVGLVNDHLRHCIVAPIGSSDGETEARLDEVAGAIHQVVRL